ncbi:hypothetical protein DFH05DRAFT_1375484, partial [Lentinula detonsa]
NTIKRNYRNAKAHGNDPYWTGKKEQPGGRPRKINGATLAEVTNQLDSGELRDGAHAQRCHFPDIFERTIRRNLSEVGYEGFVQLKKPLLKPEH